MEEKNIQAAEAQDSIAPFSLYSKIAFILAMAAISVTFMGILGLLHVPQVAFLSSSTSLFYTSFGGALGLAFIISCCIFQLKAVEHAPADQVIAKSYTIKRNGSELRIVTRRFQQRIDLLSALTKEQKFECMESGQWSLHEEGDGQYYILGKFCYLINGDEEKRCRVRLKVLPMKESAKSSNVYFSQKNNRLLLIQNGQTVPFRGNVANSYLMQKAWLFSCNHFDSMLES
ncbi:MAG: hypothetical protein K0U13_06765 [Chlamydiae bacterium]|nr:hypothetical protein [Chlamydiales bacterium]MCH9704472.1 hypothetical protein [Chlamydiota bacterium]